MSTENHNKPDAKEVIDAIIDDNAGAREVVNSGIDETSVVDSMLEDVTPQSATPDDVQNQEKENDDTQEPEIGKDEEPKEEETPTEEPKSQEEQDQGKSNETPNPEQSEPYARIGSVEFKSKDELIRYTNSQIGYNSWMTGRLRQIRPDFFNADGTIKNAELEKAISTHTETVQEATRVVNKLEDKENAGTLTEDEKSEMERAKSILKPLGVVFADDPEFQVMRDKAKKFDEQEVNSAQQYIADFEAKNPDFADHKQQVAELMEKTGYDLPTAWKAYSAVHGISQPLQVDAPPKTKPTDTVTPKGVKKQSGSMPASGDKDFIDDLLANPML